MDEMTLTLNSPITEEQWDAITDVDFEHTNEITFHTKHGKEVKFVKASARLEQRWIPCNERMPEEHEWIGTKKFGTTISNEVYVTFETPGWGEVHKTYQFSERQAESGGQTTYGGMVQRGKTDCVDASAGTVQGGRK